ncbi:MAG: SPOR domain-containing protein, partial [Kiloniellales bacterium]
AQAQQQARLPATRNSGWRLQLSSLQPLDRAQATWSRLEDSHPALAGLTFLPEPLVLNGRDFARVLAGPLDESEARRRCEALEIAGIYCLPVAGSPGYGTVVEEPPAGNPAPPVPTDSAPLPGNPSPQPSSSLAPTPLGAPPERPTVASLSQGETTTRQPADLAAPCLLQPGAAPQRLVPTDNDFRAGYEAAGRGAFDLAIAYYGRALRTVGLDDNLRALIHFNCANALHYRGDFVRATANFDRALSLNDRLVDAHYNRGFSHRALGKTGEATVDFRTAHDMGLRRLGVRAPDYAPPK